MKSFLTTVSLLSFLLVGCADNQNTSKDFKEYSLSVPEESTQTSYYSFGEDLKKGTKPADKIFTFSKSASATENAGNSATAGGAGGVGAAGQSSLVKY